MKLTERRRESLTGLFFIAPFAIGTAIFFIFPVVSSFLLSFGDMDKNRAGFHIVLSGVQHYYNAFLEDVTFVPLFLKVVKSTLIEVPLIIIFSMVVAVMLSKMDFMKGFFRVVVLLPFLLGTGEVMLQLTAQGVDKEILNIADGNLIPREFITYLGTDIVGVLDTLFGTIVKVLWNSGIQILLFLSAIQNISPALYESARLDGANEFMMFFKITLPMTSAVMLLNVIYTIVNSFTSSTNVVLNYIQTNTLAGKHGFASAMGWIYFLFILVLIGLVSWLISGYMKKSQSTVRT